MNRLLVHQLKKIFNQSLSIDPFLNSATFQQFLKAIDNAYDFKDKEVRLLERTIDTSSFELNAANILLKKQNEEISKLASQDPLTDLPNRNIFNTSIDQALKRARRYERQFSIMFIDIDRFKIINDSLGHHIGDLLLKRAALRLKSCIRESDTIARLGGDEFTILLEETYHEEHASLVSEKILREVSKPYIIEGHELLITASIGISTYPTDGRTIVDLFKNADTAMYQAKEMGRNNYQLYHSSMGEKAARHLALESKLHKAVERKEFELYYQPQLDLDTGKICGLEALIRWHSPDVGLLKPANFIPLAEETGLIIPIGEWVLNTACAQCKELLNLNLGNIRIAVNVSRRQLQYPHFIASVEKALKTHAIPSSLLEIELTESVVMQRPQYTSMILQKLKAMGIYLSIDDFGTGYSSLGNLKHFTINKLKIDQNFVSDIENDTEAQTIIEAIIAMAHSLKLKTIAEGVETQEQIEFLISKDCDQIQGYWVSKPKPFAELVDILHENRNFLL
ncbi:MAG: EAL domain-containing protein [Candidatus Omnitrophica bacterium]|nr:EAL domain-containing protein [Candidatus Omnitrophota bacterium]